MKLSEIKELITIFDESKLSTLKLESETFSLKLGKEGKKPKVIEEVVAQVAPRIPLPPKAEVAIQAPQKATNTTADFITSPMVGTFYRSPSPGAAPYISIGDTIKKGQTIGIVEAMKIMNEIEAEFDCKILEIEVNDAQPVEFGTKLVMVEKI
ncbi:acetyl-CoA carboxylase biotin carboxyl carrier protein [Helicobacter didelphidarum]|uniref:Biotin carboxyl carrier protein of acetyl-CoA carboxylase n=1 Tax=Helicobacter didelphidarum TaxID=2040648 RepID=A0A3D8ILV8_9HELI|nr:acetyl-CoA carboxylase biotin carboxyl carrier protein [Helicobacter didelphidarum]RDU66257.1 acetyl-CoA carboxylase biotin carboxyl carrier protein [Helicobacter didelphidarum]